MTERLAPPVRARGIAADGEWRSAGGKPLAAASCYILEEPGADGQLRWRGICHLRPTAAVRFGPGRFVLVLDRGEPVPLTARVTIEADSGSIRATFKDVVPPRGESDQGTRSQPRSRSRHEDDDRGATASVGERR